jgi:translation elongation factor EF-G
MFKYVDNLRSMSQGRAAYTMQFDHYQPVPIPLRPDDRDPPAAMAVA